MNSLKLTAITILMMSFAVFAQAQTKYSIGSGADINSSFNVLLLGNVFSLSTRCADATTFLSDAEIDEIVRIHNHVRGEVGAGALKWNCDLAKFSQDWANADTFEHSTVQQREQIIKGGVAGENLAIDSGSTALMADLNKGWIDERLNYTHSNNTCAPDKVCGHYTQMVWRASQEIGCGIIRNSKKLGDEFRSSYLVCTYYPGGNTVGEKPY